MAVKAPALDNVKVFNTVRNAMSQAFRDRIPEATIENIGEVGTMITSGEFQPEFNQWLHALVNRIGMVLFTDYTLENPLAKYIYGIKKPSDERVAAIKEALHTLGKELVAI